MSIEIILFIACNIIVFKIDITFKCEILHPAVSCDAPIKRLAGIPYHAQFKMPGKISPQSPYEGWERNALLHLKSGVKAII
jgi:hypothetical protein